MDMYKNIVVAVDGSDNALRAVEQAAMLAQLSPDAKVEVISVIAIDVYSDMVYDPIEAHGDAQRELVAMDRELHGVADGRIFLERDDRPGDDAHVEEVLPKRALSPNGLDLCRIAELEGAQQLGSGVLTHIVCEPSQLASRAFFVA